VAALARTYAPSTFLVAAATCAGVPLAGACAGERDGATAHASTTVAPSRLRNLMAAPSFGYEAARIARARRRRPADSLSSSCACPAVKL
jgi:hypothetical protein